MRHIICFFAALLISALGTTALPLTPSVSHQAEFFPHQEAVMAEHGNVHFAARAPPLAATNVAFTGAAVAEYGNGMIMHGHEIHVASLGFGVGFDATNRGLCSFHGDTLVLTDGGLLPISNVNTNMSVWSRNPANGDMDWQPVQAQYSNPYDETVSVTMRDVEMGIEQTIVSNRIHPYFVQTTRVVENSLEGHVYDGPLENGHWVDAAELQAGDRLLNDDGTWGEVVGVEIETKPLTAFNLTVAEFHTYFVAADENANPVWVHNDCFDKVDFNVNRLPQERQIAVNDTLSHINSGTVPSSSTGTRWGIPFRNRDGDLPTKTSDGVDISYQEYRIAPRPGQTGAGTDRIVVGNDGRQYYTGTHYGDNPGKPFVRIK